VSNTLALFVDLIEYLEFSDYSRENSGVKNSNCWSSDSHINKIEDEEVLSTRS